MIYPFALPFLAYTQYTWQVSEWLTALFWSYEANVGFERGPFRQTNMLTVIIGGGRTTSRASRQAPCQSVSSIAWTR